jgi:hypothetical protein
VDDHHFVAAMEDMMAILQVIFEKKSKKFIFFIFFLFKVEDHVSSVAVVVQ